MVPNYRGPVIPFIGEGGPFGEGPKVTFRGTAAFFGPPQKKFGSARPPHVPSTATGTLLMRDCFRRGSARTALGKRAQSEGEPSRQVHMPARDPVRIVASASRGLDEGGRE